MDEKADKPDKRDKVQMKTFEFEFFDVDQWNRIRESAGGGIVLLIPLSIWTDIVSVPDFAEIFNPATDRDILLGGLLGVFKYDNVLLYTDAFREYDRFIHPKEMFVLPESFKDVFWKIRTRQDLEDYINEALKDEDNLHSIMYGLRKYDA